MGLKRGDTKSLDYSSDGLSGLQVHLLSPRDPPRIIAERESLFAEHLDLRGRGVVCRSVMVGVRSCPSGDTYKSQSPNPKP